MQLLHSGKVRDVYLDGGDLILVASDRISVYDVVLPTPIPDKGRVLTQLSLWWFERLRGIVPHHVLSATDVPDQWRGRAVRCRRLTMVPVECIARGYLTGLGRVEYERTGAISGVGLPAGLVEADRLPEPIFTPTTKAPPGQHDEGITVADVAARAGQHAAEELHRITLEIYRRGAEIAAASGIIIADTKLEFGRAVPGGGASSDNGASSGNGSLILADEVLTPDSSRFWLADAWQPGRPQHALDKQYVRDWAAGTGWDRTPPGPAIPDHVVEATRARYLEVYRRITGTTWTGG